MSQLITFTNAFLIDGCGEDPRPDTKVVVEGPFIKEVSTGGNSGDGLKGRVIDLKGKTLMPGLIDMHVHPGNVEPSLTQTVKLPPAVYVHRVTRTLETDLAQGFTTLRDAAGLDVGFRAAIDQGFIKGPRLLLSITPLASSVGYPDQVVPPRNSLGIKPEVCDGPDQVRTAARRTLGRGADQIKVFADGEVVSQSPYDRTGPGNVKFSREELSAAVQEAKSMGCYVMAHTYCPQAILNCAQAGVHTVEHGNLLDRDTAICMAEQGTCYIPTLTVFDLAIKSEILNLDDRTRDKLSIVAEKGLEAVDLAYQAGVTIGSGSDIIGPAQGLKGRELLLKAQIMSPMEAIVSATKTNAEIAGLGDQLGTIEPGKLADLIVVDKDPLQDLQIFEQGLRHVLFVMKEGKVVKDLLTGT
jgi:imidazolonepropionase-like amidohydrolase